SGDFGYGSRSGTRQSSGRQPPKSGDFSYGHRSGTRPSSGRPRSLATSAADFSVTVRLLRRGPHGFAVSPLGGTHLRRLPEHPVAGGRLCPGRLTDAAGAAAGTRRG